MTQEEEEELLFQKVVKLKVEKDLLYVMFEEIDELKKAGYGCYVCDEKLSGLFFAYEEYKKWKNNEQRREKEINP